MEPLSTDTFFVPTLSASNTAPSWNHENAFTGKVTCSVPFSEHIPYMATLQPFIHI